MDSGLAHTPGTTIWISSKVFWDGEETPSPPCRVRATVPMEDPEGSLVGLPYRGGGHGPSDSPVCRAQIPVQSQNPRATAWCRQAGATRRPHEEKHPQIWTNWLTLLEESMSLPQQSGTHPVWGLAELPTSPAHTGQLLKRLMGCSNVAARVLCFSCLPVPGWAPIWACTPDWHGRAQTPGRGHSAVGCGAGPLWLLGRCRNCSRLHV